jgi:hypothetical protein
VVVRSYADAVALDSIVTTLFLGVVAAALVTAIWVTGANAVYGPVLDLGQGRALRAAAQIQGLLQRAFADDDLVREVRSVNVSGPFGEHWGHDPVRFIA